MRRQRRLMPLHLDGEDLMRLPLLERKARLEALLADAPPVLRFSGHMVSKQVDRPYMSGNRGVWVKTKFSEPPGIGDRRLDGSGRLALDGIRADGLAE